MELTDVIKNRRAVRDYIDAAIDRATVERNEDGVWRERPMAILGRLRTPK